MTGPTTLGTIKTLPIGSIRPSTDNPRRIPPSAVDIVAKSITEFGWQQPIVVDTQHVVIAGHTRLLAAKQLRLDTVPVVVADNLTPEQVRAYRIADNRSGDFTSWDFTELTQQLNELAPDFSDVLALADWQAIVAEYDNLAVASADPALAAPQAAAPARPAFDMHATDPDPYNPVPEQSADDPIVNYLARDFQVTVVCDSERAARTVAAAIIDMPGVIDVRNKR
jgi:hypothetical protein